MKDTSKLFKALSDETRIRILKMLEVRPLCVCEIQHALKGSQPNVSHHLKTLFDAGLVENEREGLWIVYRLAHPPQHPVKAAAMSLLRRSLKEDARVADDRSAIREIDRLSVSLKK